MTILNLPMAMTAAWWWMAALCLLVYAGVLIPDRIWDRVPRRIVAGLVTALSLAGAYTILVDVDCHWWVWCCIGIICLW